jgi:hypothetical protein
MKKINKGKRNRKRSEEIGVQIKVVVDIVGHFSVSQVQFFAAHLVHFRLRIHQKYVLHFYP